MRILALIVFALHTLLEALFGANAMVSGTFSWQSAEQFPEHAAQLSISARFLGAALLGLAALGALVLLTDGVRSVLAMRVALILAIFHTVGVFGVLLTAMSAPEIMAITNTIGALVIHAALALGFIALLLGPRDS